MNKCSIVRDLLTVYVSGLGSEDSRELVDEHVKTCTDCRYKLSELQNRVALQLRVNDATKINVFKIMKRQIFKRNVFVAVVSGLIVCLLVVTIGMNIMHSEPIEYYDGLVEVQVNYADYYKNDDDISVIITNFENSASTGKMAVLDIICTQNYYSNQSTGRTIARDGEKVRVEYVCYTQNTLSRMKSTKQQGGQVYRLFHYDRNNDNVDRVEVFYVANPQAANEMNDRDYDNYRKTGTLIWNGTLE